MEENLTEENYPDLQEPWDVPCYICDYLVRCGIGHEFNPVECPWLNHFINQNI